MKLEVYADGSATTAEKPGGYGYVITMNGTKYAEGAGYMEKASNNDAELMAAIEGLKAVSKLINSAGFVGIKSEVTLVSDSQLILGWASGEYRFKQMDKIDKYKELKGLVAQMNVKTRWVRGHSGDVHNERCDKLANEARTKVTKKAEREEAIAAGESLIGTKKSGIICVWYKESLKVIDLETNTVEDYDRSVHGSRGSMLEIREEKSR